MSSLRVTVTEVPGRCTANPPMKPGDYFTVEDGLLRIAEGGYICLWALQSLLSALHAWGQGSPEGRGCPSLAELVQCPDPKGRVTFRIAPLGHELGLPTFVPCHQPPGEADPLLDDLEVVVERVRGACPVGMSVGDRFLLRSGRLYVPPERGFCLYALQASLPLLPAKQRAIQEGDWLRDESRVICPNPAGNVLLRIERCPDRDGC